MYDEEEYIPRGKKPVSEEVQRKTNKRLRIVITILIAIFLVIHCHLYPNVCSTYLYLVIICGIRYLSIITERTAYYFHADT